MFTPFVAIQVQNKQRRAQLENNRIFSPLKNDFSYYTDPHNTSPTRSTKSNDAYLKWSTNSFRQKSDSQKIKYSTSRNQNEDKQSIQSLDPKKNLQILIRQSLRRSFTHRNNKSAQCPRTYRTKDHPRSFSSEKESHEKQKQDILDYLNELQGKRCVINISNKSKSKGFDQSIRRNKSHQPKTSGSGSGRRKNKEELQIISELSDLPNSEQKAIEETERASEVIVAIGMAAKRKQIPVTERIYSTASNQNTNKIAISTTQCLIFAEDLFKKGKHSGLYIENQANFVRVKKKSNFLNKKVAKLQKDEEEQHKKIGDPRIFEFKNNFSNNKNLNLTIGNTQNSQNHAKPKFATRKQQNIKIDGWQINVGWEAEPALF